MVCGDGEPPSQVGRCPHFQGNIHAIVDPESHITKSALGMTFQ